MLAIGRALMGRPRVLLLDEPSLGLAPVVVQLVFDAIRTIAQSGLSILLVEQNANAALTVADRGYVLSKGRIVLCDTADALAGSQSIRDAFLHTVDETPAVAAIDAVTTAIRPASVDAEASRLVDRPSAQAGALLELRHVTRRFGGLVATNDLSFRVARGQFVGVIGPNGAGKTTLLNLITGYLRPSAGEILFDGKPIHGKRPYQICRLGIGRTFPDHAAVRRDDRGRQRDDRRPLLTVAPHPARRGAPAHRRAAASWSGCRTARTHWPAR